MKMICPFCGGEMESGYLQGGAQLLFTERRKGTVLTHFNKETDLNLSSIFNLGPCFDACVCRRCEKIIFDYSKS